MTKTGSGFPTRCRSLIWGSLFMLILLAWGWTFPRFLLSLWSPAPFPLFQIGPPLLLSYLACWAFTGRHFAHIRQQLAPLWRAGLLTWLVALVAMLFALSVHDAITGTRQVMVSLLGANTKEDIWTDALFFSAPSLLAFLLAHRCIKHTTKGLSSSTPSLPVRGIVLGLFLLLSAGSAFLLINGYAFCFGTTWAPGEVWQELYLHYRSLLAFWMSMAFFPAWVIVSMPSS